MRPFKFKDIRIYWLWSLRPPVGFQRMGAGWDLRLGPLFITKPDPTPVATGRLA